MAEMRSKEKIQGAIDELFGEDDYNLSFLGAKDLQIEVLIDIRDQLKRIADRLEPVIMVEDK